MNFITNPFDTEYLELMQEILDNGITKSDRTGTGTRSVFGKMLEFDMSKGKFPLLTTKKIYFKGVIHELLWFLKGSTNIKYLVENKVHIWTDNAYDFFKKVWVHSNASESPAPSKEYFLKRVIDKPETRLLYPKTNEKYTYGDLGNVYGAQWRSWSKQLPMHLFSDHPDKNQSKLYQKEIQDPKYHIDQISNVIEAIKNNPDSRRHIVSAWNVAELDNMALPPCHTMFQFYSTPLSDEERSILARSEGLCPKWQFEIADGKPVPNQMTKTEHLDKYNVPKRKLSLLWTQRSVDVFLGLPFNIASYALLLQMVANETNHSIGTLKCSLGDCHLYLNHLDQAKVQLKRGQMMVGTKSSEIYESPTVTFDNKITNMLDIRYSDVQLNNYQAHPSIKATMAV